MISKEDIKNANQDKLIELTSFFKESDYTYHTSDNVWMVIPCLRKCFPYEFNSYDPPRAWIDFCDDIYYFLTGKEIENLNGTPPECKKKASDFVYNALQDINDTFKKEESSSKVAPIVEKDLTYKSYKNTLHESNNVEKLSAIETKNNKSSIYYSSGMTMNFGEGNIKRIHFGLSSPCDWDSKEQCFSLIQNFCNNMIKQEYSYIYELEDNAEQIDLNKELEKIKIKSLDNDQVFMVKYEDQITKSLGDFEACKYMVSATFYCGVNELKKFTHAVPKWVKSKISDIEKEFKDKSEEYKKIRKQRKSLTDVNC